MGRQEAREKGWNTFRANMLQYAQERPEFSLDDFIIQRVDGAYAFWRNARQAERHRNFTGARVSYLKASESLKQVDTLLKLPPSAALLEKLNAEYYDFVVHRDPNYRLLIKFPLLRIKEEPGILQTELYKEFSDLKREDMTCALYFAEKEGLIRREEKGRSYRLFFIRDKPDNEPLLTIQDDEIDGQDEIRARQGCRSIIIFVLWGFAFVAFGAFAGLIGAGIVTAAFIVWKIVKKFWQIKKNKGIPPWLRISVPPGQSERLEEQNQADTTAPKPIHATPEDSRNAVMAIIMFALIVLSFFIGPFALITIPAVLVLWIILMRKWLKRRAERKKAAQAENTPPPAPEPQGEGPENTP
jgi:hypothetical protein